MSSNSVIRKIYVCHLLFEIEILRRFRQWKINDNYTYWVIAVWTTIGICEICTYK